MPVLTAANWPYVSNLVLTEDKKHFTSTGADDGIKIIKKQVSREMIDRADLQSRLTRRNHAAALLL
jgi:hypothetical protein